jgi:hypothetical protein
VSVAVTHKEGFVVGIQACYESPSEIIKSSILIKQKWRGAEFRCRVS